MLDIKQIRKNPEELVAAMKARRNKGADVSGILELDEKRREVIQKTEQLKAKRNEDSAKVPVLKAGTGCFRTACGNEACCG